ncbi:MAG TPA: hypothetical protein VGK08_05995 [Thermoanaerobaculia bacterium]
MRAGDGLLPRKTHRACDGEARAGTPSANARHDPARGAPNSRWSGTGSGGHSRRLQPVAGANRRYARDHEHAGPMKHPMQNAPHPDPLPAAGEREHITAAREPHPERFCPNCGAELVDRSCKLLCPNRQCGYAMSCSDFY